ncbi:MAG TPA: isoprenylcysteine carboxylmethyltransferase family protein [Terriglobales bacterium]|nr:isoprenylcysteine carboxylmethyltransferase family protein [Terriglobales bacterium]
MLNWLWAAAGLYWVLSARGARQTAAETGERQAHRILRLFILAVTFLLLLSPSMPVGPLAVRFVPNHPAIYALGVAITSLGILLMIWARRHLGRYWSDKVEIKADHQLISTGPYSRLRHPIYTGMLVGIAGTAIAVGEWRSVAAFLLLLTNYVIKARKEERILREKFAAAFEAYERRTGFLVPRLRAKLEECKN